MRSTAFQVAATVTCQVNGGVDDSNTGASPVTVATHGHWVSRGRAWTQLAAHSAVLPSAEGMSTHVARAHQ